VNLAKLSLSVLVVFSLFVPHAVAQVGKDSGLWEFVKCDPCVESAVVVVRGNSNGGTGTGCIVAANEGPAILTAAHIADGNQSFTVSFHDGTATNNATLRGIDQEADVAVLNCQTPGGCSVLEVADEVNEGDEVNVCGFGGGGPLRCFKAKVAGVGEKSQVLFSYAIPGDSGGPVVNAAGKVCGVVSGGSVWCKKKLKNVYGHATSITAPVRAGACSAVRRLLGKR
jgi:S1-C subfamily serine protease